MGTHPRARGYALLVTFLWSSSWILIRWGLDDEALQPITFAALRYGLAFLALIGLVASRSSYRDQVRSLDPLAWRDIALLGLAFYTVTQGAQFLAIDNQPAATSGKICVAEVEEIVPVGSLDPDCIHVPSIYVKRLILGAPYDQKTEFVTTRERTAA